jgi:hypothetical protein
MTGLLLIVLLNGTIEKIKMKFSRYYSVMDMKVARSRAVDPDPHGSALI